MFPGFAAYPNRQRSSPITFSRKSPIDIALQKIPEAPITDVFREPVDFLVVFQHIVTKPGRANEPAFPWILDERIFVCTPAEWVFVLILFLQVELSLFLQTAHDRFVSIFDPFAFEVWSFRCKFPVGADGANQLRAFLVLESILFSLQQFVVDFTKRRCLMNCTRSAFRRDKVSRRDSPRNVLGTAVLQLASFLTKCFVVVVKWWLIAQPYQFRTLTS